MKTFTVHAPPDGHGDVLEQAEHFLFVRDSFVWSAAFFAPLWLLTHRLWLSFAGYVGAVALILIGFWSLGIKGSTMGWAIVLLHVLIGFEASSLRRMRLDGAGWLTLGSVIGRDAVECERRFFQQWLLPQIRRHSGSPAVAADVSGFETDSPSRPVHVPSMRPFERLRTAFKRN